jgi:hypothetical protein
MMKTSSMRLLAAAISIALAATAGSAVPDANASATKPVKASHRKAVAKPTRYRPSIPGSAQSFYALSYGVDQLSVKLAESGQLVRFNYRVTDTTKAAPLHDRASSPYLVDEKAHAMLQVPTMEKVGPLRQSVAPEYGKSYWMVFSNKGNIVKAGHRVSVVIGQVHVDGLVVQP